VRLQALLLTGLISWTTLKLKPSSQKGVEIMTYSVHEAKTQFSKLLDLVQDGEEVTIVRHGEPVAKLTAAHKNNKPILGGMRDEISWTEGWEKAFTDQEAEDFIEGRG